MSQAGRWLRAVSSRMCSARTMERVIDPIVADIQAEDAAALRAGGPWSAAWARVRGYAAFWRAVTLHVFMSSPRTVGVAIAADGWALGRMIACFTTVGLAVTLLLTAPPMLQSRP